MKRKNKLEKIIDPLDVIFVGDEEKILQKRIQKAVDIYAKRTGFAPKEIILEGYFVKPIIKGKRLE